MLLFLLLLMLLLLFLPPSLLLLLLLILLSGETLVAEKSHPVPQLRCTLINEPTN